MHHIVLGDVWVVNLCEAAVYVNFFPPCLTCKWLTLDAEASSYHLSSGTPRAVRSLQMHTHTHARAHTLANMHIRTHTHAHARTLVCTIDTHTHTHTHTHLIYFYTALHEVVPKHITFYIMTFLFTTSCYSYMLYTKMISDD